jgi:magnesium-transporting ATPase (P-type)
MKSKTQLSEVEIDRLFDFVKSKYVRFIDLQYELVDHLASSIEDIQSTDPNVSFDKALQETYSRFPITGFSQYISEKQSALNKYWARKFFRYYFEFFKLPKIILLIALSCIIWTMFQYVPHSYLAITIVSSLVIVMFYNFYKLIRTRKLSTKYSFISAYHAQQIIPSFVFIQFVTSSRIENISGVTFSPIIVIIISILTALTALITYANIAVFPELFREEVKNKYAHLNIKLA